MKENDQMTRRKERWKPWTACFLSGVLAGILALGVWQSISCDTAQAARLGGVGNEQIVAAQNKTTTALTETNRKLDMLISMFKSGQAKVVLTSQKTTGTRGVTGSRTNVKK